MYVVQNSLPTARSKHYPKYRLSLLASAGLLLGACADAPTSGADRAALSSGSELQTTKAPAPHLFMPRTLDDQFVDLEAAAPGFAGLSLDANGRVTIRVVNPSTNGARARQVAAAFARVNLGSSFTNVSETAIAVLPASFSARQLTTWKHSLLSAAIASKLIVHGVDFDEVRNRVVVFVPTADAVQQVTSLLPSLANVPISALEVQVAETPQALQQYPPGTSIIGRVRPVLAGIAIQGRVPNTGTRDLGCTLGPLVAFEDYLPPGRYALVNSHCTHEDAAPRVDGVVRGTAFWNNNSGLASGSGRIGREVMDPPLIPGGTGGCPPSAYRGCRWSDAALVQLDDSVAWNFRRIANTNASNTGFMDDAQQTWWITDQYGVIPVGTSVGKTGRSSGTTWGSVTNSCFDQVIWLETAPGQPLQDTGLVLLCQTVASVLGRPGDSGAPVFRNVGGGNAWAAGILHSGALSTNTIYFSSLGYVRYDFGLLWTYQWGA